MGALAGALIAAAIVGLGASYLMTRASRFSPVANLMLGVLTVAMGFVVLVLVLTILRRMAFG
jgi:hypothetical protein